MLDARVSSKLCTCYMTSSGGPEWLHRWRKWSANVSYASSMKSLIPKSKCNPSFLLLLWGCYTLTLPVLRQLWSWINCQTWWMFGLLWPLYETHHGVCDPWSNCKNTLSFYGKDMSWSLEHWPTSWVTKEPTLKATSSESSVSLWAYWRLEFHLTMLKPTDRWNELTKMLMLMIGKLSKDQKIDWPRHLPELVHAFNSYEIVHHWIQPTLLDVWVLTALTH